MVIKKAECKHNRKANRKIHALVFKVIKTVVHVPALRVIIAGGKHHNKAERAYYDHGYKQREIKRPLPLLHRSHARVLRLSPGVERRRVAYMLHFASLLSRVLIR